MMIMIPPVALSLLEDLKKNQFSAYVVGGCVRDQLLGRTVDDWDITTNATPAQMQQCFINSPYFINSSIHKGVKFGTIGVVVNDVTYELTTHRTEWGYHDGRHPSGIRFSSSLKQDLIRRDFTINALAYHPSQGILDYFQGQMDLNRQLIRCIGAPGDRFHQDALRILRAIRFTAHLGFLIEPHTTQAMRQSQSRLALLSKESITKELLKIFTGCYLSLALLPFLSLMSFLLPPLASISCCPSLWKQLLYQLDQAPNHPLLRLALIFCFLNIKRNLLEQTIMEQLRLSRSEKSTVIALVSTHQQNLFPTPSCLCTWLRTLGEHRLRLFIKLQQALVSTKEKSTWIACEPLLNQLLQQSPCYALHHLAINGEGLKKIGIPPTKQMGQVLNYLLDQVIAQRIPNEKTVLQQIATQWIITQPPSS